MKKLLLSAIAVLTLITVTVAQDNQVLAENTATSKPGSNENAAESQNKDIMITLRNVSEKPVAIFYGPKEEIRSPKLNTYGGLSLNKVYVKLNDVICLMTADKKPVACTVVKPGVSLVEVNSAANGISGR